MKKLIAVMLLLGWGSAQAAVVITAVESGGDVVFSTDGGTLDLTGLSLAGRSAYNPVITPAFGIAGLGATDSHADIYIGAITGPGEGGLGPGAVQVLANSGTGPAIMVGGTADYFVYVPREYVSGTVLGLATATYNSATFASLGLNEGSYLWSWAADSVTVNVVPIPAAVWLFGSGLGLLGFLRRRQLS